MTSTPVVGNRDHCGRCGTRHGGNNHLCPVHGRVSSGCCEPRCDPAEWTWSSGVGPVHRIDTDLLVCPHCQGTGVEVFVSHTDPGDVEYEPCRNGCPDTRPLTEPYDGPDAYDDVPF